MAQKHVPKSVDEYISLQEEHTRPLLVQIRDTIRAAIPDATETISWGMPTYKKKHNLIHFATAKKHIGIYPGEEAVTTFAEELVAYSFDKGNIRIPYKEPLPLDLIRRIAVWCEEHDEM
ncbi:MAG: DUF1801 domain-containing protein [Clostridia bacterium]|nr:DUF1801 domain-containing protein [Clostridia bacterium]